MGAQVWCESGRDRQECLGLRPASQPLPSKPGLAVEEQFIFLLRNKSERAFPGIFRGPENTAIYQPLNR